MSGKTCLAQGTTTWLILNCLGPEDGKPIYNDIPSTTKFLVPSMPFRHAIQITHVEMPFFRAAILETLTILSPQGQLVLV
jgi:hypothetical protein